MSSSSREEERAQTGYLLMNAVRIGSLIVVVIGIAGANNALAIPYALSAALAVSGLVAFFFAPPLIARRFKSTPEDE